GQVVRDRTAGTVDDRRAVDADPIGDGKRRSKEALLLESTAGLGAEALGQAVRSEDEERRDEDRRSAGESAERTKHQTPTARPPDERERDRQQHDGVDLRRERKSEQRERGHTVACEEKRE